MVATTVFDNLMACIETSAKKVSVWDGSPLEGIRKLSADAIGFEGEALLFNRYPSSKKLMN